MKPVVLLLYQQNISNHYVIHSLEKKYAVYKIAEKSSTIDVLSRVLKRKNDRFFSKINKLLFFVYYAVFINKKLGKTLSAEFSKYDDVIPDLIVKNINKKAAVTFGREIDPDIILVLGTSLLGKSWTKQNKPIINAHTGILPFYRGRFCWFWPIYKKDFKRVGVTIHNIVNRADSGIQVTNETIEIEKMDEVNIYSILTRLPLLIERGFLETLNQLESGQLDVKKKKQPAKVFPIYFEPGLSHFMRFQKVIKEEFHR